LPSCVPVAAPDALSAVRRLTVPERQEGCQPLVSRPGVCIGMSGFEHGVGRPAPSERSTPSSAPAARASQDRTVDCILARAVLQYGDAVALDRSAQAPADR